MDEKIKELISKIDKKTLQKYPDPVRGFLQYDVDGSWPDRFVLIRDKFKRDGFSLEACKARYGDLLGEELFNGRRKSVARTESDYSEDEWKTLCKKKNSTSLEAFISRYGKQEGVLRREQYIKKRRETYKKNGPYPPSVNLKKFIEKYGDEEGKLRYRKWIESRRRTLSLDGFIEKFGKDGVKKYNEFCKKMDTRSKNSFINRYGESEGTRLYQLSVERAKYTQSEQYYIDKYGKIEGSSRWAELCATRAQATKKSKISNSRISQQLFWKVYSKLSREQQMNCYFAELNGEYIFFTPEHTEFKSIIVDFKLGNKIIEFDGTYWHKNKKYIDKEKVDYLTKLGYVVMRIEETNFNKNNELCINKIIKFLGNEK